MNHDILLVDDARDNLTVMSELLEFHGHDVRTATNVSEAMRRIEERKPSLALIDLWLGSDPRGGIEVLRCMRDSCPMAPAIMISAHVNVESAVRAMELGAFTFLEKPITAQQIREVVRRGLEYHEQLCESVSARDGETSEHYLGGNSSAISRLRRNIERVASTNARALFVGDPGSGRVEAARYLHLCSRRAERPFFCIDASTAQEVSGRKDEDYWPPVEVLRCANGGTLLIDEIGRLPQALQTRLRRLVTSRLGPMDHRGESRIDVRITAAADGELKELVRTGRFAQDLFDRLAVIEFRVPSLAERLSDIPTLVESMARRHAEERGLATPQFDSDAVHAFRQHDWPGNLRQLENVVQEAVDTRAGEEPATVGLKDLPERFRAEAGIGSRQMVDVASLAELPLKEARAMFERAYFLELVERNHASMPRVAEISGMDRSSLYRKLNALGIGPATLASYRVDSARKPADAGGGAAPAEAAGGGAP